MNARRKGKIRFVVHLETKTRAMLDRTDTIRRIKRELMQEVSDYPVEKTIEFADEAYSLLKETALERAITVNHCLNLMIQQAITDAGAELVSFH